MLGTFNDQRSESRTTRVETQAPKRKEPSQRTTDSEQSFNDQSLLDILKDPILSRIGGPVSAISNLASDFFRLDKKISELNNLEAGSIEELNLNLEQRELGVKLSAINAGLSLQQPGLEYVFENLREVNASAISRLEERYRKERRSLSTAKDIRAGLGFAAIWASILLL